MRGVFYMFGFSLFAAAAYLTAEAAFLWFNISVANAIFWGFFWALFGGGPFFLRNRVVRGKMVDCLRLHWKVLFLIVGLISLAAILWFLVLSQSNSGVMSLLDKTEVFWAILLGGVFLGERIRGREFFGIVLAIVGIVLVSSLRGEINFYLSGLALFSAFLYSMQSFLVKRFVSDIDGFSFAFLRGLGLLLVIGVFFGVQGKIEFIGWQPALLVGFGQFCGLLVARVFYFEAHRFLEISKLNLFQLLIPVFVFVGQYFLFPEITFSLQKMVGAGFVLGGLGVFVWQRKKPVQVEKA